MRRADASNPVTLDELRRMAAERFGDMVKGVVDLRRGVDDAATRESIRSLVERLVRR